MKSWAVTQAGQALEEIEIPSPSAPIGTEVVLDVSHCGVCHSDVHFWEGFLNVGDKKIPLEAIGMHTPYTLGHEIVGKIAAIGPDVEGVKVGDIRLVYPWIGCGQCSDCAREDDNLCSSMQSLGMRATGGFARQVSVPHQKYLVDIGDLDPALAATYACSGLTVYSAIQKLIPLAKDDPVVLIGAGGLGLNAISVLKALGHENIVVLDVSEQNRQTAIDMGASAVADNSKEDILDTLPKIANGSIKSIIDMVNSADTALLAFNALAKGGKLVQVGLFGGTLTIPLSLMPSRVISIIGNLVGNPQELRDLITLARSGKISPIPISCKPRSAVSDALSDLRDGKVKGRIVLDSALSD
ncbi:MAG: alcohol dehydrogenase catalytic domain-containing protein [Rhizobiaceae bacterium]|nr:alcohol dehydrogenase catalytic domain-containing protein [Rhizobiaceae bacterium]